MKAHGKAARLWALMKRKGSSMPDQFGPDIPEQQLPVAQLEAPDNWGPEKIAQFQKLWDDLVSEKSKAPMRLVPRYTGLEQLIDDWVHAQRGSPLSRNTAAWSHFTQSVEGLKIRLRSFLS